MRRETLYRKFLEPVVNVYRSMGVPAYHGRAADLDVRNRKICGTGAGEIGDCVAFVGNIILDFDFRMMSAILRVPDEGFRHRARTAMEENMTTVRREIGASAASKWDIARITAALVYEFEKVLGSLEPGCEDSELNGTVAELARTMINDTWLRRTRKQAPGRTVTIRSGLQLVQESIESPAGVVTAQFEIRDGKLAAVSILGESARDRGNGVTQLESLLEGVPVKEIRREMSKLFADPHCMIAGLGRDQWMRLLGAR
jgi:lipoate-protein ligase A